MATTLSLELTRDALPLDGLAEAVRATATRLNLRAPVPEYPEPVGEVVPATPSCTTSTPWRTWRAATVSSSSTRTTTCGRRRSWPASPCRTSGRG